jgi:hypothetical protein
MNQEVSNGVSSSKYRNVPSWCSTIQLGGLTYSQSTLATAIDFPNGRLQEKKTARSHLTSKALSNYVLNSEVPLCLSGRYSRSWPTVTHPVYWAYSITRIHGHLERGWSTYRGKYRIWNTFWQTPWHLIVTGFVCFKCDLPYPILQIRSGPNEFWKLMT